MCPELPCCSVICQQEHTRGVMLQETADVVASIEAVAGLLGVSRTEVEALVSEHPRYGPLQGLSSMHSRRVCMS